jgi:hypothetical protein
VRKFAFDARGCTDEHVSGGMSAQVGDSARRRARSKRRLAGARSEQRVSKLEGELAVDDKERLVKS